MAVLSSVTMQSFSPAFPDAVGDVRGIVARTVLSARAAGRDYLGQSQAAAAAVVAVRPDLSPREALDAVMRLRESMLS
jgi:hypothetical protein